MEGSLPTLRGQQHKERSPLCLSPGYALPMHSPGPPLLWSREARMHCCTESIQLPPASPPPSTRDSGMMQVLGQQDLGVSWGEWEPAILSLAPPDISGLVTQTNPQLNWQMHSRGVILLTCTMEGSAGCNDQLGLLNVFTKK